jgi:hypothetical protein
MIRLFDMARNEPIVTVSAMKDSVNSAVALIDMLCWFGAAVAVRIFYFGSWSWREAPTTLPTPIYLPGAALEDQGRHQMKFVRTLHTHLLSASTRHILGCPFVT